MMIICYIEIQNCTEIYDKKNSELDILILISTNLPHLMNNDVIWLNKKIGNDDKLMFNIK